MIIQVGAVGRKSKAARKEVKARRRCPPPRYGSLTEHLDGCRQCARGAVLRGRGPGRAPDGIFLIRQTPEETSSDFGGVGAAAHGLSRPLQHSHRQSAVVFTVT